MRTVIIVIAALLGGLWTLAAWGIASLVDIAGTTAAANADLLPVTPEWVVFASEMLGGATGIGSVLVWILWGIGALLIAGVALLAIVLTDRRGGPRHPTAQRVREAFDRTLR